MADYGADSGAGVSEGDILAGKYRVERVLGIGGMGVVVAAHHIQLDEKVALKFLLPEALQNPEAVTRFAREARAAVKIKSEHVARVTDVGTLDNGAPYMVMEYLDGIDLSGWLTDHGALAIEQAVEFLLQACVAVADAHALGIVHRDLKPANLFCIRRSDGLFSIKVLDFGISKMSSPNGMAAAAATRTTALMGSPYYMSPEQLRSSRDVDFLTDLWALGVILFELLTGRHPFDGESVTDLAITIVSEPAPPLRQFRPDAPPALEAVILKCLEKRKENRFTDVAQLAVALLPFGPPRARASVERISGIIRSASLVSKGSFSTSNGPALSGTLPAPLGITPGFAPVPAGTGRGATGDPATDVVAATAVSPRPGDLLVGTLPPLGRTTLAQPSAGWRKAALGVGVVLVVALAGAGVWMRVAPPGTAAPAAPKEATANMLTAAPKVEPPSPPPPSHGAPDPMPTASVKVLSIPAQEPVAEAPRVVVRATKPPAVVAPAAAPVEKRPVASPSAVATVTPAPAPVPAPAPTSSPAAVAKCDPPYFFDSKGNRIFKKECL